MMFSDFQRQDTEGLPSSSRLSWEACDGGSKILTTPDSFQEKPSGDRSVEMSC